MINMTCLSLFSLSAMKATPASEKKAYTDDAN